MGMKNEDLRQCDLFEQPPKDAVPSPQPYSDNEFAWETPEPPPYADTADDNYWASLMAREPLRPENEQIIAIQDKTKPVVKTLQESFPDQGTPRPPSGEETYVQGIQNDNDKTLHPDQGEQLSQLVKEQQWQIARRKTITGESTVIKSNNIYECFRYFTVQEFRLMYFCLAHIDSVNDNKCVFKAHIEDLTRIFTNLNRKSAYSIIKDTIIRINSRPLLIDDEYEQRKGIIFWFSSFDYYERTGTFVFTFSDRLLPYLTDIKSHFTMTKLRHVEQFKTATTYLLYDLLLMNKFIGKWYVDLEELHYKLNLTGKYKSWAIFKRDIITKCLKEINEKSDLNVTFTETSKIGKRVLGITFFIDKKIDDDIINVESESKRIYELLAKCGIHEKTANDYALYIYNIGKSNFILTKLERIIETAREMRKSNGTPIQRYVLGAIKKELKQQSLIDINNDEQNDPDNSNTNYIPRPSKRELYDQSQYTEQILQQIKSELVTRFDGDVARAEQVILIFFAHEVCFLEDHQNIIVLCSNVYHAASLEDYKDDITRAVITVYRKRYNIIITSD